MNEVVQWVFIALPYVIVGGIVRAYYIDAHKRGWKGRDDEPSQ